MTYSFMTSLVDCLTFAEQAMRFTIKLTPGNSFNGEKILLKKSKVHTDNNEGHTL